MPTTITLTRGPSKPLLLILVILLLCATGHFIHSANGLSFKCDGETFTTPQVVSVGNASIGPHSSPDDVLISNCVFRAGLVINGPYTHGSISADQASSDDVLRPIVNVHNSSFGTNSSSSDDGLTLFGMHLHGIHIAASTITTLRLDTLRIDEKILLDDKGGKLIQELRVVKVVLPPLPTMSGDDELDASRSRGWTAGEFCPGDWEDKSGKSKLATSIIDDALSTDVPLWAFVVMGVLGFLVIILFAVAINARQAAKERNDLQRQVSQLLADKCRSVDATETNFDEEGANSSNSGEHPITLIKCASNASSTAGTNKRAKGGAGSSSTKNPFTLSGGNMSQGTNSGTNGSSTRNGLSIVDEDDEDLEVHEL